MRIPCKQILKNWIQSNSNHLYLWGEDNKYCIEDAYYSAINCAAIHDSKANTVVVLCLDINENKLMIDSTADDCKYLKRYCINYRDFNINECDLIPFKYRPECRAKYLYNIYNNTCGTRWDSIKDYVVDIDQVSIECKRIYHETHECEIWFHEILYKNNKI